MQSDHVQLIYDFNDKAGLLAKPYNDFLESSFQIEEALEGFDLSGFQGLPGLEDITPKSLSRYIAATAMDSTRLSLSDVDRLDKACDAIVFAFGSIFKLGLSPDQASEAVSIVMRANMAKLSMPKDEFGKLQKPIDFIGPETHLQELLNQRKEP